VISTGRRCSRAIPYVGATIDLGQLKLSEAPGLGLSVR
jgi:hypothetical protein